MLFCKGTIDHVQPGFLSDHIPGVMNLRKFTQPGEVLFRRAETDDFQVAPADVEAMLERMLTTVPA